MQKNAGLKPFRNKGWPYHNKFQIMYPTVGARGSSAYHASIAQSSRQSVGDSVTVPAATEAVFQQSTANQENTTAITPITEPGTPGTPVDDTESDYMEITPPPASSTITTNKRKIDTIIRESITRASQDYGSQSQNSLVTVASDHSHPSKRSQLSLPETLPRPSSDSRLQNHAPKKILKVTPATAVIGMQGSINRLTDVIQNQMVMPQSSEDRQELRKEQALRMLQELDDGLTLDEKTEMVVLFQDDAHATSTFVKLTDDTLRRSWLRKMLARRAKDLEEF
jgi:hypothetical protein